MLQSALYFRIHLLFFLNERELPPLSTCSALHTLIVGGSSAKTWTWSGSTHNSCISMSCRVAISRNATSHCLRNPSNRKTGYRYFGVQIKWKQFCPTACVVLSSFL